MKDFDINNCRLCNKVFCCKNCREKHEMLIHKIMPQCDICCYGNIIASSISEQLLKHIQTNHWPLYCVFCKKIFTFEELSNHTKCAAYANLPSPYLVCSKFDSPPVAPIFEKPQPNNINSIVISNLATSTPTQKSDDNNLILEKIQEVIITPSFEENTIDSIIKKYMTVDSNVFSKRRVTFSTPLTEDEQDLERKNEENKNSENITNTPLGFTSTTYYTAKDFSQENQMFIENISTPMLPISKREEVCKLSDIKHDGEVAMEENKTLWVSAVDFSAITHEGATKAFAAEIKLDSFITPVGNFKKKQISIVMPTPLIQEDVKFNRPVQISSTPNSSIIPIKSAPTRKDIFRSEEPSSSKSNFEMSESDHCSKENSQEHKKIAVRSYAMPSKIWTSVTKMVKNITSVLQNFQTVEGPSLLSPNKSMKRYSSDQDLAEGPVVKRYKLTEIKCRPSIRGLPAPREKSGEIHINIVSNVISNTNIINNTAARIKKTFADKATQTEESILQNIADILN